MRRFLGMPVPWRRRLIGALVVSTTVALVVGMTLAFAPGGLTVLEAVMLLAFAATLPWQVLGFWNAVIGFWILRLERDPVGLVTELEDRTDGPITATTAVAIPIRNEAVEPVFTRIRTMLASLDRRQPDAPVSLFVLSDSSRPEIIAQEEAAVAALGDARVSYRRRRENTGFKAGNLRELVLRRADDFELLVVLDADSLMTATALRRAIRIMERSPRLGLLQTLVVGMPSASPFARLFQFGMRQGMRSYTTGSCWWQGDAGPYWGHNAVIRMKAFAEHGALPVLPGEGPLGGCVLSHDQVEAALLRAGGWEVRVLPIEDGSFEENPPSLVDYLQRDLRWCQGNLQYIRLLPRLRGLRAMGVIQLLLAIWMYAAAPFWMLFMATGALQAARLMPEVGFYDMASADLGAGLFITMMIIVFAPKTAGVLDLLLDPAQRRAYGGVGAILRSAAAELIFSLFLGPVAALHETAFMIGLLFGKRIRWSGQQRDAEGLSFAEAARVGALPTVVGALFLALLVARAPAVIPFALPVLLGWGLAIPFAWITASPRLGAWMARMGLAAIPEERTRVREVDAVLGERPAPAPRPVGIPAAVSGLTGSR